MDDFLEKLDEIDASIFSGEALEDPEKIRELRKFMDRWTRAANEHQAMIKKTYHEDQLKLISPDCVCGVCMWTEYGLCKNCSGTKSDALAYHQEESLN